jgi:hypothetical protein
MGLKEEPAMERLEVEAMVDWLKPPLLLPRVKPCRFL